MNNKGFTLVELITTFAITSVIIIILMNVIVIIKDILSNTEIKTELYINQWNLSNAINSRIRNNENHLIEYDTCEDASFCYMFTFEDYTTSKLMIEDSVITFDKYVYKLDKNTKVIDPTLETIADTSTSNTHLDLIVLKIPIKSSIYPDLDFGITSIYLKKSSIA